MAAPELEYLQYTYVNNILKSKGKLCDDSVCHCLDILQMSLLSLILKEGVEYPDGALFNFHDTVHICVTETDNQLFTIDKCEDKELEGFAKNSIFFDEARKKRFENDFTLDLNLERRSIDFLGTALFVLNGDANDISIRKSRDCDSLLLDISLLNPRLLLIISYNMFYGFLLTFEDSIKYNKKNVLARYVNLLKEANTRMKSIPVKDERMKIIKEYREIFAGKSYNRTDISDRFGEYFYGLTFEKDRTEEINILGHLDYLCALMERFEKQYLSNDSDLANKKVLDEYISRLREIMDANISQDSKYLQAQYKAGAIGRVFSIEDLKKEIINYCNENHLFIVGVSNPLIQVKADEVIQEENKKRVKIPSVKTRIKDKFRTLIAVGKKEEKSKKK